MASKIGSQVSIGLPLDFESFHERDLAGVNFSVKYRIVWAFDCRRLQ